MSALILFVCVKPVAYIFLDLQKQGGCCLKIDFWLLLIKLPKNRVYIQPLHTKNDPAVAVCGQKSSDRIMSRFYLLKWRMEF